ncbi:pseudouridine synthase [Motiliproteus sp. MSK22-1]|uniref:pseudouridine synthase n=1 Tax=Motiliproteus sp. MSK22-1 TaxID=1897630 RepID=UPI0009787F53|nr:16S rRNA pseudouridine(516) synthase [Motiliproteus sp. MSK22-1]OMH30798.1 16S rRNA pseudouridine(516) synthase [Motiliproteus sp. MSK22-1]
MRLDRFLSNNTEFSRKQIRLMLAQGMAKVAGQTVTEGRLDINEFTEVTFDNKTLQSKTAHYLMINKPCGCLSATSDPKHPTIMERVNEPFRRQLHIGGRLDFNTSGLLLITNDGKWSRRLTQPEEKIAKVYRVETEDVIHPEYIEAFRQGMYFQYEGITTQPAELKILDDRLARLTLFEGRYHQVKRMFGRFNNRVTALHRESMGSIILDPSLAAGEYRALTPEEISFTAVPATIIPSTINSSATIPLFC